MGSRARPFLPLRPGAFYNHIQAQGGLGALAASRWPWCPWSGHRDLAKHHYHHAGPMGSLQDIIACVARNRCLKKEGVKGEGGLGWVQGDVATMIGASSGSPYTSPPLILFSPLKEGVGGDDGWMKVVGDFAVPAGRCGTQTCGKAEKTSDASPGPPARNRGTTPEPPGRARSRPRGVRRVRDGLSPERGGQGTG